MDVLLIVGALGSIVCLIWFLIALIRKKKKKGCLIGALVSLALVFTAAMLSPSGGIVPADENAPPVSEEELPELYTSPNHFKGRVVALSGQVFSAPEYDKDGVYLQVFVPVGGEDQNTIVFYPDPAFQTEEGNYIRISGVVQGEFSGKNAFGGKITAPSIAATTAENLSYQDAMAPTLYTLVPDTPTMEQHGYKVTVEKVELAAQETRVYVKVENNGSSNFSLYDFDCIIIQGGTQYAYEENWEAEYPQVQTDLRPGVSTEGIICFPAVENGAMQVVLEGVSEDFTEEFEDFTFDIAP